MQKLKPLILVCLLAFSLPVSKSFASENSAFASPPNLLEQTPQSSIKSVVFGDQVLGILIPKSVSDRCDCLLVWNGIHWNEDSYYSTFGESVLGSNGFYRPYNYSSRAYPVRLNKTEWSKLKQSHQFYKSFKSKYFNSLSVIQLDSPHAPFVYVETSLNGKFEVFRLETPQDLTSNIEAWLKKAHFEAADNQVNLSLTYDLYQTGTGQEPGLFTVRYQFKDGSWHALQAK